MLSPRTWNPLPKPTRKEKAKRKPLKRYARVRRVSKKRAMEGRTYSKLRADFLFERSRCEAWKIIWPHDIFDTPVATDIHHKEGRGRNYLNTGTWMAVSRRAHDWIHTHPKEARALGLLV